MFRARLASVALAAGIGLTTGCSSDFSLKNMFHHKDSATACCTPDCPTCCGGDVAGFEGGPILAPPPDAGLVLPPTVPPLAGPPRLVPTPATPMPYTP